MTIKKIDVGRSGDSWGRFYEDNMWIKDEVYKGKSEVYAKAAENYALGIKMLGKSFLSRIYQRIISVFGTMFNEIDIQR